MRYNEMICVPCAIFLDMEFTLCSATCTLTQIDSIKTYSILTKWQPKHLPAKRGRQCRTPWHSARLHNHCIPHFVSPPRTSPDLVLLHILPYVCLKILYSVVLNEVPYKSVNDWMRATRMKGAVCCKIRYWRSRSVRSTYTGRYERCAKLTTDQEASGVLWGRRLSAFHAQ